MHPNREPPRFDWARLVYDIDSAATVLVSNEPDPDVARVSVWVYDLQADTWTEKGGAPTDTVVSLGYDPVDRLVVYTASAGGPETWLFDVRTGTWSRSSAQTPGVVAGLGPPRIEYDEAAKRTVIMSNAAAAAHDASANRWEMLVA